MLDANQRHDAVPLPDGTILVTLKTANPVTGASVVSAAFKLSSHNALWLSDALKCGAVEVMMTEDGDSSQEPAAVLSLPQKK